MQDLSSAVESEPLELVGRSSAAARLQELVRRAATAPGAVLLVAEPGAEPDAIARELHHRSARAAEPFACVDCSASGDPLALEHDLFGDPQARSGDLEAVGLGSRLVTAQNGTIFLRDVTEMPAAIQARLARVLRDGQAIVDGAVVSIGVRVVASAAPSIDGDVHERRFRADLYRRLSTTRIDMPPLADRTDDLPQIAALVLDDICAARGVAPRRFTQAALALVAAVRWPGNLAELRMAIGRIAASPDSGPVQIEHVLPALQLDRAVPRFAPSGSLREARRRFERDYVAAVLQHHDWKMADAAETLGIQRPNLYRKARQLGIPLTRSVD